MQNSRTTAGETATYKHTGPIVLVIIRDCHARHNLVVTANNATEERTYRRMATRHGYLVAVRKPKNPKYMFANLEHFMQTVNSYHGLLGWCNTNRLRHAVMEEIKTGPFGRAFVFSPDDRKVNIKPSFTRDAHYKRKNKNRKTLLHLWIIQT